VSRIGIVIIGRNEGERLVRCLRSVADAGAAIIYVDSGSTDDSVANAHQAGATVVTLYPNVRFSAARARNAGYKRLIELDPNVEYVQFIDGDCEVVGDWIGRSVQELTGRPGTAVVCGNVIERHPDASVYNRLCQLEWQRIPGEIEHCGGIFAIRTRAFDQVGGFRDDVIAGEEPELCIRLRAAGWKIVHVDADMVWHDTAMFRFSQWWTRARRSGHAYAQGAAIHGRSPARHCVRDCNRIWLWGVAIPTLALLAAYWTRGVSLLLLGLYPLLALRIYRYGRRRGWRSVEALTYAAFTVLAKFPGLLGMLQFHRARLLGHRPVLIEYKEQAHAITRQPALSGQSYEPR
jgi:GT2 family glycosyltransferase